MTQVTKPANAPEVSLPIHRKPNQNSTSTQSSSASDATATHPTTRFPKDWQISMEAQLDTVVRRALLHRGWPESQSQNFDMETCIELPVAEMVERIEAGKAGVEFEGVESRRVMQRLITREVNARLERADMLLSEQVEAEGKQKVGGTGLEDGDGGEGEEDDGREDKEESWVHV